MTKHLSFRRLIIAFCIFAMGAMAFSLINIKSQTQTERVQADGGLVVTAQLVDTNVTYVDNEYSNAIGSTQTTVATINDGDTVVLKNTEAYETAKKSGGWSESGQNGVATQAVRFAMGTSDSSVQFALLSISATLNGQDLAIDNPSTNNTFEQYIFGLPNELYVTDTNNNRVLLPETYGRFVFNYTYRVSDSTGGTGQEMKGSFSFNLLTEPYLSTTTIVDEEQGTTQEVNAWDYSNLYKFVEGADTNFADLESATRDDQSLYFNYNNFTYSELQDYLQMPIISYDATKYNLTYTRRIYNSLETVTSQMTVKEDGEKLNAVITFTSNLDGKVETFTYNIEDLNENPIVELVFEDIGEYEFTMNILTKIDDTTYLPVANTQPNLLNAQSTVRNLTIFGYQLKYADGNTNTAELRSVEYSLYADVTHLNKNLMSTKLTVSNIGQLKLFTDENGKISVPSTNQAPLWLDYLGTLDILNTSQYFYYAKTATMDYSKLGEYTPTEIGEYKKGQYFMNAGLYVLEINYTLSSISYSNQYFKQYFVFEISNTAPTAQIIKLGDGTTLFNDGFTNQNVAINWDVSNPFNAEIIARYDRYNFDNVLAVENGVINRYGTENQTTLSANGKYYIKLYYGRLSTSYTAWEFTIDKDGISGLTINFADELIKPSVDALSVSSLNEAFTLSWNSKASGAQISLEHQQMLLIKDDAYVVNALDNLVQIGQDENGNIIYALKNGYKTSTISSSITYKNITEFSVTQYALHLFRLYDEAGNELYYAVLLDNTSPSFIFDPAIENKYNIVKDTTGIVWGDAKAITFNTPVTGQSALFDAFVANNKLPSICNINKGILNIEFNSVNVHHAQKQSELYQTNITVTSPAMQIVIDTDKGLITAYSSEIEINGGKLNFINSSTPLIASVSTDLEEYYYSVDVIDNGTIASGSTNYGKSTTQLEVNLDASQVLAFTDENADIRIYNGSATNQDKLYVNYFSERDEFVVESLIVEFYPLAMDKDLDTYPYLNEPTITQDLKATATYDAVSGKMKTEYFNLVYSSELGREVTQAGKYVVTRVYEYNPALFEEGEDDPKRTKEYTFYVDRNDIVENITVDYPIKVDNVDVFTRTVGEYIKLALGINGQQYAEFTDLLLSSNNNNVILSTDLLPINPIVPENKYSVLDESTVNYTNIASFNLNLKIEYKATTASDDKFESVVEVSANSTNGVIQQLLQIDSKKLMRVGIYRFTLTDNVGYSQIVDNVMTSNIDPNTFSFRIQVTKQAPEGTYYGTPNADGTDKEIVYSTSSVGTSVYSSSDDELKFVFEETTDIYKAKVNYTEVVVDRKTKGSTQWETAVTIKFDEATYDENNQVIYPSSIDLTSLDQAKGIREPIRETDIYGNPIIDSEGNFVYKLDSAGNMIYKYSIILPTKNRSGSYYEGEYRVTIHYYGDEEYYKNDLGTVSYYTSSINVVLDHTAPNFNLLRLVYADKYLPETSADANVISKQDIVEYAKNLLETNPEKKERVRQFLRTYTFALPSDFVFYKATNDGFSASLYDDYTYPEHDTSSIFVRKYNKYSTTEEDNEQSYINSDPEYSDPTKQRFEVSNSDYKQISYGEYGTPKDPFYLTIAQETNNAEGYGQEGYYEIIEIDQAGNQRIYTVYLKTSETAMVFTDNSVSQVGDALHPSLSLGYGYSLAEIQNLDCYTTIKLYDRTSGNVLLQTFDITPTTNIEKVIEDINSHIDESTAHNETGARYDIEFLNRFGEDYTISLQRPGEQLGYTIVESTLSFSITLPVSTNSTWIEEFIVKQYNETTGTLQTLTYDLNGPISDTNFSGVTYTFSSGEYYFYLIDNFGRGETQPIHYIFGIVDAKDLVFSGIEIDNTTASDVQFTYQTKLYSVEVYVNGTLVNDFTNYNNITVVDNPSLYTRQFNFGAVKNERTQYRIVLNYNTGGLDITTEPIVFDFVIDTILPSFELTDTSGNNMNYLLSNNDSSTSKEVFINWTDPTNFPVTVTIKRNNGTAVEISKNYSLYLEGTYTLTMTNTLGNSVSYTFSISQNSAILYDVFANNEKIDYGLASALFSLSGSFNGESFDINDYMKVYVNIYPMTVVANENKDLQSKLVYEYDYANVYNLKIYHIFGSSSLYYSEYIALLQIDSSILSITNFFIGETSDLMSQAVGYSATYYSPKVLASWIKSFNLNVMGFGQLVFEDFIKVDIYYNNVYVSQFDSNNLEFTDSGEYRLYFSDIAGNKYRFTSGLSTRDYYTIDLLNSVSFKVNDAEPINYAIYNDKVTLTVTNTSRYDSGTFKMQITFNGESVNASDYYSSKEKSYIFSKYGTYKVVMTAQINSTPITSEYIFTILSKNEAQDRFSFSEYDSFEIVSVVKEGVDITEQLKQAQGTSKLMSLNLSTGNSDNGHYVITVKVTQSQLKPVQSFTFEVWINNADINLVPSIPFGTSTTSKITIELNKYAIHQALGNVVIKISGMDDIIINADTAKDNVVSTITLEDNRTYLIQAYTESGRLLSSYVITKDEPLNTVAIIAIVIGVLAVIVIAVLFIIFRTRMKVR